MRNHVERDLPIKRPVTLREAREQVQQIYRENRWDEREQAFHQASLGLAAKPLCDRNADEFRVILGHFEKRGMILYSN